MSMLREPATGRLRWRRLLLALALGGAVVGSITAYVGYRLLFRKNPEVMREIKAAEERQQAIDDVFEEGPAPEAQPAATRPE